MITFDIPGVLQRLQGDEAFLEELLQAYLSDYPQRFVAMRAAFATGDLVALGRLAHSAKGASATVGAVRLQELAAQLDGACRAGNATEAAKMLELVFAEESTTEKALREWLASRQ